MFVELLSNGYRYYKYWQRWFLRSIVYGFCYYHMQEASRRTL